MKIVETRAVPVGEVMFRQEFYPRHKPNTATIEQYLDALRDGAEFPPIEVDVEGMLLLDGYHRWKAAVEAGLPEIKAKLIDLEGMPRLLHAASRNAMHGDRLTSAEKKEVARAMAQQGMAQVEIRKWLGVSAGTVSNWVSDIVVQSAREREAQVWWLALLGWTLKEIGETLALSKSEVDRLAARFAELNLSEKAERGQTPEQIAESEGLPLRLVRAALLAGEDDPGRLAALRIGIQPYDVWNFSGCDPRFGEEYPGRIPGQLILHLLYFYSQPGDLVVDPMVGSGTTIDACAYLGRRVYGLDAHPTGERNDILEHDMFEHGWPARTAQAQLILWDPPYYKKMDNAYGDKSISRLNRSEYLAFFQRAAGTIPEAFKGRLAFICSDYTNPDQAEDNIYVWDYLQLFQTAGWRIEQRIQAPLTTQQVHPDLVNRFRQARRLARLNRDIVVMRRG